MKMTCKKHNRLKTEMWEEKQARGGSLTRLGCPECKAESSNAPPRPRPAPRPRAGRRSFTSPRRRL